MLIGCQETSSVGGCTASNPCRVRCKYLVLDPRVQYMCEMEGNRNPTRGWRQDRRDHLAPELSRQLKILLLLLLLLSTASGEMFTC